MTYYLLYDQESCTGKPTTNVSSSVLQIYQEFFYVLFSLQSWMIAKTGICLHPVHYSSYPPFVAELQGKPESRSKTQHDDYTCTIDIQSYSFAG